MSSNLVLKTAAAVFLATTSAFAHSDVLVRDVGGKVAVGTADLDIPEFELGPIVFEGIFIDVPAAPPFNFQFSQTEPGFNSTVGISEGDDLPANADLTISLSPFNLGAGSDAVHYWNGSGPVSFNPLATAQPGVSFDFDNPQFAATDNTGFLEDHPIFGLRGPAADGVYLTSVVLDVDGLQQSDPFYFVWLAATPPLGEDPAMFAEEIEEAIEALEEFGTPAVVGGVDFSFYEEAVEFAETIPEPSTGLLMLAALLGSLGVRRR